MSAENDALLRYRILFLSGTVDEDTANRLVSQLLLLDADDHESPIDFYINSGGGSVTDGVAIIDAMQCIQAPVRTICIGQAASMAAFILAAGERGHRIAAPNAEVMIHQVGGGVNGKTADIQVQAERITRLQESMVAMLADWTGKKHSRIRQDMERDYFMSSREACEYGIIDEVLEPYRR